MLSKKIIFRADANNQIGLGHIMRCLALASILKNKFHCIFVIASTDTKITTLISQMCPVIILLSKNQKEELYELEKVLESDDIVVTDGYHFDTCYQKHIKSKVKSLVMIDDKADMDYFADIIINHGNSAIKNTYKAQSYTQILTGFSYLMVRPEFLAASHKNRQVYKNGTVFICMGGADPFNITIKAFEACITTDFVKNIIIITGSSYAYKTKLKSLININKHKTVDWNEDVSAKTLVELIKKSQIAICPASTIALEVCCVKAALLTGTVRDNQEAIHNQLLYSECCISLGNMNIATIQDFKSALLSLNNVQFINDIVRAQSKAIDGKSGERILNIFEQVSKH